MFAGLSESGLNQFKFDIDASFPAWAPALNAGVGNVVISMIGACGSVNALAESPFTALEPVDDLDRVLHSRAAG